ncbi:MAG: hypothetical protein V1489_01525 [Candidatus Liptonbacteria bacterium]
MMRKWTVTLGAIGLLVANTIGAGIFALPYVAKTGGWGTFFVYLVGLGIILLFVHGLYGRALDRTSEHHRLTGLVHLYLPKRVLSAAVVSILGGLLLTLVAYIVLGASFVKILFPGISLATAMALMWLAGSLPLLLRLKKMVALEFLGTSAMAAIILVILFFSRSPSALFSGVAFNSSNIFFPFGPLLFALAGWTAIGPMREYERNVGFENHPKFSSIVWGTVAVVVLYGMFVVGIFGSASNIVPDTLSGLAGWPALMIKLLALFGLAAIWTSYIPASEEVRDSLERDFKWHAGAITFTLFMPILMIVVGLTNFFSVVSLAGGIFLAAQYIFIIFVIKNSLRISLLERLFLDFAAIVFTLGAVYEVCQFVVR